MEEDHRIPAAARAEYPQNTLVLFCPLNVNGNHFTLLEINERESMIYYYNSKGFLIAKPLSKLV